MTDILTNPLLLDVLARFGVLAVGVVVALESFGVPVPGETVLVTAALSAGATGVPEIAAVVAAAALGAIVGDNAGYLLGRRFGGRALLRWGPRLRISEGRIKLGRYLFARYGMMVVFAGRFFAVLRALAAFMAGVNLMPWARFFVANAAGAIIWAGLFGYGAFWLGQGFRAASRDLAIGLVAIGLGAVTLAFLVLRRFAATLQARAEAAYPGPMGEGWGEGAPQASP